MTKPRFPATRILPPESPKAARRETSAAVHSSGCSTGFLVGLKALSKQDAQFQSGDNNLASNRFV